MSFHTLLLRLWRTLHVGSIQRSCNFMSVLRSAFAGAALRIHSRGSLDREMQALRDAARRLETHQQGFSGRLPAEPSRAAPWHKCAQTPQSYMFLHSSV